MEVEGQMDARAVLAVVGHQPVDGQVELADQEPVAVLFEHVAHLARRPRVPRAGRWCRQGAAHRTVQLVRSSGLGGLSRRCSSLTSCQMASTLNPSTPRSSQKRRTSIIAALTSGLRQLRSGCSLQEGVIVVLLRRLIPLPGSTAEGAQPVVGGPAIGVRVAPDVPVAFGVLARGARLDEPGVLVRGVVRDEVEDHLDAAPVRLGDEARRSP